MELCTRSALFLLSCHQGRIVASAQLLPELRRLRVVLARAVGDYREVCGSTCAGLRYLLRQKELSEQDGQSLEQAVAVAEDRDTDRAEKKGKARRAADVTEEKRKKKRIRG